MDAVLFVAGASIGAGGPQQQSDGLSPAVVSPERAVNRYCVGCHNSTKTAGLALDAISVENANQHAEVWKKAVRKLRPRYMPPAGVPRPDEPTYNALVSPNSAGCLLDLHQRPLSG